MPPRQLIDPYKRHLNYLRISITDRCNLRCVYCIPAGRIPRLSHADILRYEEIYRIVNVGIDLGISKIRITGGEPLVRKGACEFLARLRATAGLEDISLTTNGVLLAQYLPNILQAGIRRINISLDTLQKNKYAAITGQDRFNSVWQGIHDALAAGFHPIKLNVVALRGVNDDEFMDLARLSLRYPLHVRFIEFMPIGDLHRSFEDPILVPEIKRRLSVLGPLRPVAKAAADGPAERYRFDGAPGEIGFISALSHHFCRDCNRLRLTASGQLRACLLSDRQIDVKTPLRRGCTDKEIRALFWAAVRSKPLAHDLTTRTNIRLRSQMCTIGG